jgi:hypothetical protein
VRALDCRSRIDDGAMIVWILQEHSERVRQLVVRERIGRPDVEADAERFRPAAQHAQGLREAAFRHQEHALLPGLRLLRLQPVEHRHRFGRGRAFVEERRGGDVRSGEVFHDRLEVEERFEPALRDLRLVRSVGRVPRRVLEDVPQNHAGCDAVVVPHPDVRASDYVPAGHCAQASQVLVLAFARGKVERPGGANARRNRLVDQRVERGHADGAQHLAASRFVWSDVP